MLTRRRLWAARHAVEAELCVSPAITAAVYGLNDAMPFEEELDVTPQGPI